MRYLRPSRGHRRRYTIHDINITNIGNILNINHKRRKEREEKKSQEEPATWPVGMAPRERMMSSDSLWIDAPPLRTIAPATPPPCINISSIYHYIIRKRKGRRDRVELLAALTRASACSWVRSPCFTVMVTREPGTFTDFPFELSDAL